MNYSYYVKTGPDGVLTPSQCAGFKRFDRVELELNGEGYFVVCHKDMTKQKRQEATS